jgi:hypothetical protein
MEVQQQVEAEHLISHLRCSRALACRQAVAAHLHEKGNGPLHGLCPCLRSDAGSCPHSLFFGMRYLCKCPIRTYLAEILEDSLRPEAAVPL